MALISCSQCGGKISDKAKICPHCHHNFKFSQAFNDLRIKDIKKGKIVQFGKYYKNNPNDFEPIEWEILDVTNGEVLLLSKYIIDAKAWDEFSTDSFLTQFSANSITTTWSVCGLRKWLNNDFLKFAFNEVELKNIVCHKNETLNSKCIDPFALYGNIAEIPGGMPTDDFVFLLSKDEVLKYFNKKSSSYAFGYESVFIMKGIVTTGTPYAKNKGLYYSDTKDETSTYWWLRSPGGFADMAALIIHGDTLYSPGEKIEDETIGVRPAIWVKKDGLLTKEKNIKTSKPQNSFLDLFRKRNDSVEVCQGGDCDQADNPINYAEGEYWLEHDNGSSASIFDMDSSDFENWHDDLDD